RQRRRRARRAARAGLGGRPRRGQDGAASEAGRSVPLRPRRRGGRLLPRPRPRRPRRRPAGRHVGPERAALCRHTRHAARRCRPGPRLHGHRQEGQGARAARVPRGPHRR
ncbi:hypothetical protein BN1708_019873, partial [Verticillium longisporum]